MHLIKTKKVILMFLLLLLSVFGCSNSNLVSIQVVNRTIVERGGQEINIPVRIKNYSIEGLNSDNGYFLSYHLLDENGEILVFDNERTELSLIQKGEYQDLNMKFISPEKAGKYIIEVDIVQEGVSWLKEKGSNTDRGKIEVKLDK